MENSICWCSVSLQVKYTFQVTYGQIPSLIQSWCGIQTSQIKNLSLQSLQSLQCYIICNGYVTTALHLKWQQVFTKGYNHMSLYLSAKILSMVL